MQANVRLAGDLLEDRISKHLKKRTMANRRISDDGSSGGWC